MMVSICNRVYFQEPMGLPLQYWTPNWGSEKVAASGSMLQKAGVSSLLTMGVRMSLCIRSVMVSCSVHRTALSPVPLPNESVFGNGQFVHLFIYLPVYLFSVQLFIYHLLFCQFVYLFNYYLFRLIYLSAYLFSQLVIFIFTYLYNIYKEPTWCNLAVCLLVTARILYMFRTLFASILRST